MMILITADLAVVAGAEGFQRQVNAGETPEEVSADAGYYSDGTLTGC